MAYSDTLNLVTGDTLPELPFTLKDSNTAAAGKILDPNDSSTWAPIDLTGDSVKLRIRALGSTTIKATLPCTVVDETGGEVVTNFAISGVSVLDTAGTFECELELTTGDNPVEIQTVNELIKFKVRADFD